MSTIEGRYKYLRLTALTAAIRSIFYEINCKADRLLLKESIVRENELEEARVISGHEFILNPLKRVKIQWELRLFIKNIDKINKGGTDENSPIDS